MKKINLIILTSIVIVAVSSYTNIDVYAKPSKEIEVVALDIEKVVEEGHENLDLDEPEIEEAIDTSVSHGTPLDIEKQKEEALRLAREEADKKAQEKVEKENTVLKENSEQIGPGMPNKAQIETDINVKTNNFDRKKLVEYALSFVGYKYIYGGTTPAGFDCSGFTQYVYKNAVSKNLLRNSASQSTQGRSVSFEDIQVGDLLFYSSGSRINHVGIYIGNNKIVHASNPTSGVKISPWNYRNPVAIKNILD